MPNRIFYATRITVCFCGNPIIAHNLLNDCESAKETIELTEQIARRSIKIEWPELSVYVNENSRIGKVSEKLVISSNNMPVPIPAKVVNIYAQI